VSNLDYNRIVEEILNRMSGASFRPGANYEIPGFDPDYQTQAVRFDKQMSETEINDEMVFPVGSGETKQHTFKCDIRDLVDNERTGIVIKTPSDPQAGSGVSIDGRQWYAGADGFNTPIGNLKNGMHIIEVVLHNGERPGIVGLTYGDPVADSDGSETIECVNGSGETVDTQALVDAGATSITFTVLITITNGDTTGATSPYLVVSIGGTDEQISPLPANNPDFNFSQNFTFRVNAGAGFTITAVAFDTGKGSVTPSIEDWEACANASATTPPEETTPGVPTLGRGSKGQGHSIGDSRNA